jgi:formylglycine-generating enzyme required for sulfatase activity
LTGAAVVVTIFLPPAGGGAGRKRLRVLRGGSFNNNPRNARCAYRNHNHPNNDWNNNGFRVGVVASHNPPG